MKLPKEFYLRENVLQIASELLGKVLFTRKDNLLTGGVIVETEAYMAPEDKASHAFGNRRTARTEIFYSEGGVSYVYLCYGIHSLFNIITNRKDIPHAVLVRAIEPIEGIGHMLARRKKTIANPELTSGPGSLSVALGIDRSFNGEILTGEKIWLEDAGIKLAENDIMKRPRVGIAYAQEYIDKPWRFSIRENKWVSKAK